MTKEMFMTDGDYAINLNNVKSAYCILENVTYITKPTQADYKTGRHNIISNIRTFYVRNYFLVTEKIEGGNTTKHDITKYLLRSKALRKGRNSFRELYSIANDYVSLQNLREAHILKIYFIRLNNL